MSEKSSKKPLKESSKRNSQLSKMKKLLTDSYQFREANKQYLLPAISSTKSKVKYILIESGKTIRYNSD